MRIESSVTAISWIPSDAIEGMPKLPFELGVARYDEPPPDRLEEGDLERLRAEDRFREANRLAAWIDVEDGQVVGHGYEGTGLVGSTTFSLGVTDITIPGVAFEVLRSEPEAAGDAVRFVQTVGGRAGFPAPRRVVGRPFVRIHSATAWTTLALTIRNRRLLGARARRREHLPQALDLRPGREPRREDGDDRLQGLVPRGTRRANAVGRRGVRCVRHGRGERARAGDLARADGGQDDLRPAHARPDETLVEQGAPGDELYLVLDGVLVVEIDGEEVAEIGPGAIVGEKALLEGGTRTATLRARTRCRVAVIPGELIDRQELEDLAATRRA